jgi:hypothetical protein
MSYSLLQVCFYLMVTHIGPKHLADYNNTYYHKQTTES